MEFLIYDQIITDKRECQFAPRIYCVNLRPIVLGEFFQKGKKNRICKKILKNEKHSNE